ncbi:MAG: MATE family efflux transporter [Clostridium sp.]|nr:MATE family efflux transporter [Clostridium sp.]
MNLIELNSLMSIIQAVGFGLGMGANSLISRNLGAKKDNDACKYGNSTFSAAIIFGLCLMVFGLLGLHLLIRILGSTETMLPYSCDYGKYILIGASVMCSSFVLNNIIRFEGHALYAMWGLCIGGILNMIVDPIFIFGFDMGISGAAIATIVSFMRLLSIFIRNKSIVKLGLKYISRNSRDYLHIVKTGFPTICRQMLGSVSSALLNIQAAVFGDAAVGTITIANKIYIFVRNVILGIGQGFQPVVGYNYGDHNKKRVKEAFIFSCTAALVIGLNTSGVIAWFRKDDMEVI